MILEDQVCSLEFAKKLKELGVKQKSLFAYLKVKNEWRIVAHSPQLEVRSFYVGKNLISAFTVAELGEMLPHSVIRDDEEYKITPSAAGGGLKYIDYTTYEDGVGTYLKGYPITSGKTEANARAKILIYLIENKLYDDKKDNNNKKK